MLLRSSHRYIAEASDREGRRLAELTLAPDFAPAAECSHLEGVRRGHLPSLAHHGPGVIEPVFDEGEGQPYVAGFRVRFDAADPAFEAPLIPWTYFQPCVETSATRLVRTGTLHGGESFVYRICAFPLAGDPVATEPGDGPAPLELERVSLAPRMAGATPACEAAWNRGDFPVFVQPAVLREATERARAAGVHETGGVLVGHLHRDTDTSEIHVEVTAQIPATQAQAGHAHLSFTPKAWSAVSDALALRRRGEKIVGWWHYHPYFCRNCDLERQRRCALSQPFFSRDDCELHRAVFDAAFSVAMLLSDVGRAALSCDWFGWRHGNVAARGCYLLPGGETTKTSLHASEGARPVARVLGLREDQHEH